MHSEVNIKASLCTPSDAKQPVHVQHCSVQTCPVAAQQQISLH
jgi:hypothetical protein